MHCPEFRDQLRNLLDGDVDSRTRKQLGLHMAGCEDCARLADDDTFWDEAVRSLLDREAPADLRAAILGEEHQQQASGKSGYGFRNQLRIIWWAARRDHTPRLWLESAALMAAVLLVVHLWTGRGDTPETPPFATPGPVVQLDGSGSLELDSPLEAGHLKLNGPLL